MAAAAPPTALGCTGVFARDSSHARVVAAFGARNVTFKTVPLPEGETGKATVVLDKNGKPRLHFIWRDEKRRRNLPSVFVYDSANWRTPQGVAVGSTLADVERINGKPFTLLGFGWDYSGTVSNWDGGTLDKPEGGCRFIVRFEATIPNAPGADALDGDKEISSADPIMQAVKPKIYDLGLDYSE